MKKNLFLSPFFLLFSVVLFSQNRDTIKIERPHYKILIIPFKNKNLKNLNKIENSTKFKYGKASDINFIKHNVDSLRKAKTLLPDMLIGEVYKIDHKYRLFNYITSNILKTRRDSVDCFKKRLYEYFILREY